MGILLELLAFTSLWVAASASALCAAAGRALGAEPGAATLVLAAAGTVFVYNLDRLRDVERDRATSPRRTAFVEQWRGPLIALTAVAAGLAVGLTLYAGNGAIALLAPIAALGLAHRRLKRFAWWKPFYPCAWTIVVVGLPAVTGESVRYLPWVVAIVAATIVANVIASNLRDREAPAAMRFGARVPIRVARVLSLAAGVLALTAPEGARSLAPIPLATLATLVAFRPTELYGFIAVDGALLMGALMSLAAP